MATENNCKMSPLTNDKDYYYEICVIDGSENKSEPCLTGKAKTSKVAKPSITYTNTPNKIQNGYLQSQVANVEYIPTSYRYVRSSKVGESNINITESCGTGNEPGECISITSTTSMEANVWYKVSGDLSVTYTGNTEEGSIYAIVNDGTSFGDTVSGGLSKTEIDKPEIEIGEAIVKTNKIIIPTTITDTKSGVGGATCKYSETNGTYNIDGEVTNSENTYTCALSGLKSGRTYYYEICAVDKVGNSECETGNSETSSIPEATFSVWQGKNAANTNISAQNGYVYSDVVRVTYTNANIEGTPTYYVKSGTTSTSSLGLTKSCGTDVDPGECSDITSTTEMTKNTWYIVTGTVDITNIENGTQGTVYSYIKDPAGNGNRRQSATSSSKIDRIEPTITLGTSAASADKITVSSTINDDKSGVSSATCKYGVTDGSYTTSGSVTNSGNTYTCEISVSGSDEIYYYQICATDKVGNVTTGTNCKTGSQERLLDASTLLYDNTIVNKTNCTTVNCALDELYTFVNN